MEAELRIYSVEPDRLDAWIGEWREHVAPLRRRFGFRVLGPWIDRESATFVWLLEFGGADGYDAADARYYQSEERRSLDPDPARHLVRIETRRLRALATAPRLFRVIVPVGAIDEAAAFYEHVLGVRGERVSAGRHYLDCGGTILALFDALAEDGERLPPNPEHLYLSVDDLTAARRRAIAAGGRDVGEIGRQPWGERSFYLRDPFGNPLCLVERGSEFTGATATG